MICVADLQKAIVDLGTAIARMKRHRAWAERTLRWAHSVEKDYPGQVEHSQHTIKVAEEVFQRVVMAAADAEANKKKN
jgi:hypothetical protein